MGLQPPEASRGGSDDERAHPSWLEVVPAARGLGRVEGILSGPPLQWTARGTLPPQGPGHLEWAPSALRAQDRTAPLPSPEQQNSVAPASSKGHLLPSVAGDLPFPRASVPG